MSDLKLLEKFTVDAPTDWVWKLLLNIEKVVAFFPGAQLDTHEGGNEAEEVIRCRGALLFTVGKLTVEIGGSATLSELDYFEHSFKPEGTGDEQSGQGGIKFKVLARLTPIPAVGIEDAEEAAAAERCTVSFEAEAELSGAISRVERTLLQQAGQSLFGQLREGLCARMAETKAVYERASLNTELAELREVLNESARELEAAQAAAAAEAARKAQKASDPLGYLATDKGLGRKSRRISAVTLKMALVAIPQSQAVSVIIRPFRRLLELLRSFFRAVKARSKPASSSPERRARGSATSAENPPRRG
jgi:carbon monoxide dehydrogenase subunit G